MSRYSLVADCLHPLYQHMTVPVSVSAYDIQLCSLPVPQDKESYNSHNKYNHNFCGLYCTCDRPYPDSEDEVSTHPEVMVTEILSVLWTCYV